MCVTFMVCTLEVGSGPSTANGYLLYINLALHSRFKTNFDHIVTRMMTVLLPEHGLCCSMLITELTIHFDQLQT